jgi:ABC-type glycerol-3-phosphate transport system permease component
MIKKRKVKNDILLYIICIFVILIVIAPLIWIGLSSFKSMWDVQKVPVEFFPRKPTIETYKFIFTDQRYGNWGKFIFNSLKISVITTVIVTIFASLSGYAFSRFRFKGAGFMLILLLVSQMFPGPSLLIPIYRLINALGLIDSHFAIILINVTLTLPFAVWLAIGSFENIPKDIEEAAYIDGCSPIKAFLKVVLPVSKIGIISVAIYTFLLAWAEYIFSLVILSSEMQRTVSLQLGAMASEINVVWNEIGAATMTVSVPLLIFFLWAQKYFVKGMVSGSIKE